VYWRIWEDAEDCPWNKDEIGPNGEGDGLTINNPKPFCCPLPTPESEIIVV